MFFPAYVLHLLIGVPKLVLRSQSCCSTCYKLGISPDVSKKLVSFRCLIEHLLFPH